MSFRTSLREFCQVMATSSIRIGDRDFPIQLVDGPVHYRGEEGDFLWDLDNGVLLLSDRVSPERLPSVLGEAKRMLTSRRLPFVLVPFAGDVS